MSTIKYLLPLCLALLISKTTLLAQEIELGDANQNRTYTEIFDDQFVISSMDVPSNYLYDRVFPTASLDKNLPCDTIQSERIVQGWWEMENCRLDHEASNDFTITQELLDNTLLGSDLPVVGLDFEATKIRDDAFVDGSFLEDDGRFYPSQDTQPFENFHTSMAGLGRLEVETETDYAIYLSPSFFKSNVGTSVVKTQISGLHFETLILLPGDTAFIRFSDLGDQTINLEVTLSDQTVICSKSPVRIIPKLYKKSGHCDDGALYIIESDIPFRGLMEEKGTTSLADAHIYYHKSPGQDCQLIRPAIIVDGFDPRDPRRYVDIYSSVSYQTVIKQENLIEQLRQKGYDVIILNFPVLGSEAILGRAEVKQFKANGSFEKYVNRIGRDGGADYIQRNAFLTVKLIQEVNQMLQKNGSDEELIVIGPSMGGLITRYALAYMEAQDAKGVENMDHNTRLWLSLDAPHAGANIPKSTQLMVDFFGNQKGDQATAKIFRQRLRSIAARQLLLKTYESVWDDQNYKSKEHFISFYQQLKSNGLPNSDGWPQKTRKICVSNGSLKGDSSFFPLTHDVQIDVDKKFGIVAYYVQAFNAELKYGPSYGQSGTYFIARYMNDKIDFPIIVKTEARSFNTNPKGNYDIVQGALYTQVKELTEAILIKAKKDIKRDDRLNIKYTGSDFTFIPTISTLGLKNTNIPWNSNLAGKNLVCEDLTYFDNIYYPEKDEFHVQITADNAKWILQEVERGQPNCERMCAEADDWPEAVCQGETAELKLKNLPQNTSYSIKWGMDNGIILKSGQGTNKAVVEGKSNASRYPFYQVSGIVVPSCAADFFVTKTIEVPNIYLDIEGKEEICAFSEEYHVLSKSQAQNRHWYFGDIHGTYYTGSPYAYVNAPTNTNDASLSAYSTFSGSRIGNYRLFVEADNICGEKMTGQKVVRILPKSSCDETMKGRDVAKINQLIVFPNPSSQHWSVNLLKENDKIRSLMIRNLNGQILVNRVNVAGEFVIDISGNELPHGIYLLEVQTEKGERFSTRLIKRHN